MNNSSNIRLWAVICVALSSAFSAFAPVVRASDDIVFADFEGPDYGAWKVEGDAFGSGPVSKSFPNQKPVTGFVGHGFVNSYHGGDRATGRLTSPEFKIERRYITFLIGGGGWEGKTCINLVMDEKIVRTATGPNVERGGSEELSLASWDVASFAGKTARIEIVDQATGAWGHINVDQIVFTDTPPRVEAAPQPVSTRPEEVLYNGIVLPSEWPPRITDPKSRSPREVPYLEHPPRVINIDVGRQLFVDDFLIVILRPLVVLVLLGLREQELGVEAAASLVIALALRIRALT